MNYYQFHIGDYAAHTRNLSILEDIAYRRLLDAYYLAERPLSGCSTDVARHIGMSDHLLSVEWILSVFFEVCDDGWLNKRADAEIAKFKEKRAKASIAGRASAESKINGRSTDVQRTFNQPRTKNQEPIKDLCGKPHAIAVLDFLNVTAGKNFKPVGANINLILARMKEGFTDSDLREVVERKCRQWKGDEKMDGYLRPKTLFNSTNFAQYQGEADQTKKSNREII